MHIYIYYGTEGRTRIKTIKIKSYLIVVIVQLISLEHDCQQRSPTMVDRTDGCGYPWWFCVDCSGDDQDYQPRSQRLLLARTGTGTPDDFDRSANRCVTGGGRETRGPECVNTRGQWQQWMTIRSVRTRGWPGHRSTISTQWHAHGVK